MNKIQRVINVGDEVYLYPGGKAEKITKVLSTGFFCGGKYFSYDRHRKNYFLTRAGLMHNASIRKTQERR